MTHPRSLFITAAATALLALALPALAAPFDDNGDGTVTDEATGLVWDQCSWGQTWSSGPPPSCSGSAAIYTWTDALAQADAANAAGYRGHRDWRLPNRTELESLIDISQAEPASSDAFKVAFPNPPDWWFWSSTTYAAEATLAWNVSFGNGATHINSKTDSDPVRLVRGGPSFAPFDAAAQALTVAVSGGGAVNAGASPLPTTGGIAGCSSAGGAACAASYTFTSPAAEVTLSASVPANQQVTWGGACSGTASTCVVTMDQARHVTADFALNTYTVSGSAIPAAGGSVTCPPDPVTHGSTTTCTVSPNPGYTLDEVSSSCGGSLSGSSFTTEPVTAACSVSAHFKANQTITLTAPDAQAFSPGGSFTVTASASSGLPVDLQSSTPTICTVSGSTVSLVKAGTCTLVADQAGNDNYAAATQVKQSVTIGKAPQTLSFPEQTPPSHTFVQDGRFPIQPATSAEPNSDQPITYSSLTADICTVAGTEVSMLAPGNCTIAADQAGDDNYAAATQVKQSVALNAQKSFSGTTVPSDPSDAGPATASFSGGGDACRFDLDASAFIAAPAEPPAGKTLPQGLFKFKLVGCEEGSTISMTVTWPQAVTAYIKHGKESASAAAASYFQPDGLAINGHSVSFSVRDGDKGDDDWQVNGEIVDPSGPLAEAATPAEVTPIPTLGEWGLLLLGLLAAGLGMHRLRRG